MRTVHRHHAPHHHTYSPDPSNLPLHLYTSQVLTRFYQNQHRSKQPARLMPLPWGKNCSENNSRLITTRHVCLEERQGRGATAQTLDNLVDRRHSIAFCLLDFLNSTSHFNRLNAGL